MNLTKIREKGRTSICEEDHLPARLATFESHFLSSSILAFLKLSLVTSYYTKVSLFTYMNQKLLL